MAKTNAERQKAWRERHRACGKRPRWVAVDDKKVFQMQVGGWTLTLTKRGRDEKDT